MSKQSAKGSRRARGARPGLGAALIVLAAMALALCAAGFLAPAGREDAPLPVVIQAVMSANPSLCYSVEGSYYDWIALKNTSDEAVNLNGWRLTDAGDLRGAFTFGDIALSPGESMIAYCDRTPQDYSGGAIFTGFRLSGDGELLMLADAGQGVSALQVPALAKGEVYLRDDATGAYAAVPHEQAAGLPPDAASSPRYDPEGVMLSELMPQNRSTITDADGDFSDWIELHNGGSRPVSLEGYGLSDSERTLRKWVFPDVTLKAGEYRIVFASGKDRRDPDGELHTSFKLSGEGETVRLSDPDGRVISQIEYRGAEADQSFTRDSGGAVSAALSPSPGVAEGGGARLQSNALGLYINEVCTGGIDGDWIELYNQSGVPVDLSGMGLSDDPSHPRRWQFPAGASIPAGGYLVVSGSGARDEDSTLRPAYTTDFGIAAGETVCLSTAEGQLIDRLTLTGTEIPGSAGRAAGMDAVRWFGQTTPGQPNADVSYAKGVQRIEFSPAGGQVRGDSVTVALTSDAPIYYTTDGSDPTRASTPYTGPITLTETACIRAATPDGDALVNLPCAATYVFEPHAHRLVCLSGNPAELIGETGMLNTGARDANTDVFAEIYDPDGTRLIDQSCHMTITGHNTRTKNSQKAFKLNARRTTGDTRFRAALFSNRDYDACKVLSLRCSGQDYKETHMRDSVLTSLMAGTNVMYQETEVCVLYVNGNYWGLYNLREHIDRHSICEKEGWDDPMSVNIVQRTGENINATAGKSDDYKKLIEWVKKTDLSKDENLETLKQSMVIESYLDYVAMQMYTCNQDLSNIRCYRSLTEDNRWRWAIYDFDLSFRLNAENYISDWFTRSVGNITGQDTTLFRALMKNAGVRDRFLARMGELLADNYRSENVVAKIEARRDLIADEMVNNCRRWSWSYETWQNEVQKIIDYAKVRPGIVVDYMCETFELNESERRHYFGAALDEINRYQAAS